MPSYEGSLRMKVKGTKVFIPSYEIKIALCIYVTFITRNPKSVNTDLLWGTPIAISPPRLIKYGINQAALAPSENAIKTRSKCTSLVFAPRFCRSELGRFHSTGRWGPEGTTCWRLPTTHPPSEPSTFWPSWCDRAEGSDACFPAVGPSVALVGGNRWRANLNPKIRPSKRNPRKSSSFISHVFACTFTIILLSYTYFIN